jgi:hypothetical protein
MNKQELPSHFSVFIVYIILNVKVFFEGAEEIPFTPIGCGGEKAFID